MSKSIFSSSVRAAHQRHWSSEKVNSMLESIKAYQSKSENVIGRSHILPQENALDNKCIISPLKVPPRSLRDIESQCEAIKKRLHLNEEEIKKIEQKTRGQSKIFTGSSEIQLLLLLMAWYQILLYPSETELKRCGLARSIMGR